jgi:transposase
MKRTPKRPKPLSKQAQNFILRNYKTMPLNDICEKLKRPYSTVYSWLWKRGLVDVKQADYNEPPYCTILQYYIEGWYIEDIAEMVGQTEGFCRNVIHRVFRTYNIPSRAAMNAYEPDSYVVREKETE